MQVLTEEQVQEIRLGAAQGISYTELAANFNVSRTTISGIARGLTWTGDRAKCGPKPKPLIEKFSRGFDQGNEDDCWLWTGTVGREDEYGSKYGYISHNGKKIGAHVAAFELNHRLLKDGEWVLHTCNQAACVNPKHLYATTRQGWVEKWHKSSEVTPEQRKAVREAARISYQMRKAAVRRYQANLHRDNKIRAVMVKGGRCERCGWDEHPAGLQFHHRDPLLKKFAVTTKVLATPNRFPWVMIEEEIQKCDLLCANCHFIIESAWEVAEDWNTNEEQS